MSKALNSVSGFHQQKLQLYTDGPEGGTALQMSSKYTSIFFFLYSISERL